METLTSKVDGNHEPSRWYTSGRCRDYLGASVHLITGESVPRPTSNAGGDDIVHAPVKAGNQSYNISPETTPFISNMSNRRDVKNTYFEWQTDVLAAAAQNAVIDGDDLGTSFTSVVPTVRLGGYTQISRKDFAIADNLDGAIDEAGRRTEIAYQLAKQGNELKRDQEFNLVGLNQSAVAGNNTTIRKTASLSAWIGTNVSHGTNGASPGGGTAATDGTQRAMTEGMLKSVMQLAWTQGGSPDFLLVGPHVKTVVSSFSGIAEQRYMAPSDGPTTIIGAADVNLGVAA